MTFGDKILQFYSTLEIPTRLPRGVEVLNPYRDPVALEICRAFYGKYYHDNQKRFLILGINPGRYGAGITGVPFADPIKLETVLGIKNFLPKKPELSADFIHSVVSGFGGADRFFSRFFINSVSPLGFVRDGKNLNYYDDPALKKALRPFIRKSIGGLLRMDVATDVVFCLGEGQNLKYLQSINGEDRLFGRIVPLAHPRFIMQYRRKYVDRYVEDYLARLNAVL